MATRRTTKHELPALPYAYDALEPVVNTEIMTLHHTKHHQAYVNNLNAAEQRMDDAISANDLPTQLALHSAIKFNAGGHINHSIFWNNLAPESQCSPPEGDLAKEIARQWGDLGRFKEIMNSKTAAVQGSGWGWLTFNRDTRTLEIQTYSNQDPVSGPNVPLLGIDVWEHAYYLQYKNARPAYLKEIWRVVNWKDVAERYEKAKSM